MLLKVVVSMTPGLSLKNNTSMAEILELDLQVVTMGQLRVVIEQINEG